MCKAAPEIPQLWILCSSRHPEPKPCPPRAEPGSCFNWWCPGVTHCQLEAREPSFCAAPGLHGGFSRRLAVTQQPALPTRSPEVLGTQLQTLPGWRAHCTQHLLHRPSRRTAPRGQWWLQEAQQRAPRQRPSSMGGSQSTEAAPSLGSYQLTILGTCCTALASRCFRSKSSNGSTRTVPNAGGHCARRHREEHKCFQGLLYSQGILAEFGNNSGIHLLNYEIP